MSQDDFEFWTDESKAPNDMIKSFIEGTRKQLLPIRERIEFFKDGQEFITGIQAISAPGHTVGHTVFMITSQGKQLCNTGDLAHHHVIPLEKPRLEFAFDTDGKQGAATRIKMFGMLAAQRIPIAVLSFPLAGHRLSRQAGRRLSLLSVADPDGAVRELRSGRWRFAIRSPARSSPVKNFKKKDFPVRDMRRLIEPGPIVLVSSHWKGRNNIMTMGWHMVMDYSTIGCFIWDQNHSLRDDPQEQGMRDQRPDLRHRPQGDRDRQFHRRARSTSSRNSV